MDSPIRWFLAWSTLVTLGACSDDVSPQADDSTGGATSITTGNNETGGMTSTTANATTANSTGEQGSTGGGADAASEGSTSANDDTTGGDTTGGDTTGDDTTGDGTTGEFQDDTIYEIQEGLLPEGTMVDVRSVWVTGVRGDAFYAQEEPGGQFSGVHVFVGAGPASPDISGLEVGDIVDIVGVVAEVDDRTEIDATMGTVVETGSLPALPVPNPIALIHLLGLAAEGWEGVFVRIEADIGVAALLGAGEFTADDMSAPGTIDDYLFDVLVDGAAEFPGFRIGATFSYIQGPIHFAEGEYKLAPRMPSDFGDYALGPVGVDWLTVGDLVITEVMESPQCSNGGNNFCEWLEVYNAAAYPIDLNGLRIQDQDLSDEAIVDQPFVVLPGTYATIGKVDETEWTDGAWTDVGGGPHTFTNTQLPIFHDNGEDFAVIANSSGVLDQIPGWINYGPDDNGLSFKLEVGVLDTVSNDDFANWCHSTQLIVGSPNNYGTPGAANTDPCHASFP
ncbi:MAG: lamin tail domain-containing protein [Myxococcota bacterium]